MDSTTKNPTTKDGIELHCEADFEGMRKAGRLAAETLDMITEHVVPGVTTEELDRLCHLYCTKHGAIPAPLNYGGSFDRIPFPKSICTSINHVVCHGIPEDRKLKDGDIVNIDVTVILDGWHGDTSRTYLVGDNVKVKPKKLVAVTYECMMAGIEAVKPGALIGDIGRAIQEIAHKNHYSVVEDFCGHGLGLTFHAPPSILHYAEPNPQDKLANTVMESGMFFTIEPMINTGKKECKVLDDGWTAVTRDKSPTAQFEHSLAVTETGYEIFTLSPKGWTKPPYL